ncbi:hypothetical protein QX233_22810, partial [Chryseobacterium gambrini]
VPLALTPVPVVTVPFPPSAAIGDSVFVPALAFALVFAAALAFVAFVALAPGADEAEKSTGVRVVEFIASGWSARASRVSGITIRGP